MPIKYFAQAAPENARTLLMLTIAKICNIDLVPADNFIPYVDNEKDEYLLNCHPLGRQPAIETENGCIFATPAIIRYFASVDKNNNNNLLGSNDYEAALVDSWLDYMQTEINAATLPFLKQFVGKLVLTPEQEKEAAANLDIILLGLNNWLETRTYLVGERPTLADYGIAFALQWAYRTPAYPIAEELSKKYKNCWRLYNTIMHSAPVLEVLKANGATFGLQPKPKEEKAPATKDSKKSKKDDADDEEEVVKVEKKNPLDLLPPSKLDLDAWKRQYSNNDTRTVAAPWFFEHFDPEGFTCYWAKYKYNEENTRQFMTANLIRGWFQRMEGCRKYAFGVALIIGTESAHEITSFWIIRGKGIPQCVNDVEDTILFDWTEIKDINAEKELITDYLCWEGPSIPKPVLEGKCFK